MVTTNAEVCVILHLGGILLRLASPQQEEEEDLSPAAPVICCTQEGHYLQHVSCCLLQWTPVARLLQGLTFARNKQTLLANLFHII